MVMGKGDVNSCCLFLFCFLQIMECIILFFNNVHYVCCSSFEWILCGVVVLFFVTYPKIGFVIKCRVQRPMRSKKCVQTQNTLLQMGESVKEGTQWLLNIIPLWELHLCKNPKCLKPWLKRQTITKLNPLYTIGKVLKCRGLKCHFIVHLDLKCMNYDQKNNREEFDS
jgi:hypothetical protein